MNQQPKRGRCTLALLTSILALIAVGRAGAASRQSTHSAQARIEPYLIANSQEEVALARSAAPPSISAQATVMVLAAGGYVTAAKGSNGFVCLVERSWSNALTVKSTDFWNPKLRAPFCFNAAGAQSVMPRYLMRTEWVISGASQSEISDRDDAAWAAGKFKQPAAGAMSYMMSRRGQWIGNHPGPWRPHLMFYFPTATAPNWGGKLAATPVTPSSGAHTTEFVVLVPAWPDGSPAPSLK